VFETDSNASPTRVFRDEFGNRNRLRVLVVTSEWPSHDGDVAGIHIVNQVKRLREANIDVDVFHFRGNKNLFRYLAAITDFRRLALSDYDVVHAHHGQSGLIALCQRSCPVVVTYHGSDLQGIRAKNGRWALHGYALRAISWSVAHFVDEVIIVSEHLARYLPLCSYTVIPAGIDTELFSPVSQTFARQTLGLPLEEKLVLFVGGPQRPEKRYYLAKSAVDIIASSFPVKLVLADGIPNEKMPLYMSACDALLVTSANEGSPNVVKEALACNLPVVSVNVGDIGRRITPIVGCALCLDDKPETIARELQKVLERGGRVSGRETVLNLEERLLVNQVVAVYKKALTRRGRKGYTS